MTFKDFRRDILDRKIERAKAASRPACSECKGEKGETCEWCWGTGFEPRASLLSQSQETQS